MLLNTTVLALLFHLTISQATHTTLTSQNGFSIQLLHRDAIQNPSLFANLTTTQRLLRQLNSTKSYIHELTSRIIKGYNTTTIKSPLYSAQLYFMAVVSIGTQGGQQTYPLLLDTGSGLTWTQCVSCSPCFPQHQPLFDPRRSPTYRSLPSNDPKCREPFYHQGDKCMYDLQYLDQSTAAGVVSTDTITFMNGAYQNLVFGCTYRSHMPIFDGRVAGIMGMDRSAASLAVQLARVTNGRFSHCFFPPNTAELGYLRFGNDIVMQNPVSRTQFANVPGQERFFNLNLEGISVQSRRLSISPRMFGHVMIDSGSTASLLIRPVYAIVRRALVTLFNSIGMQPVGSRTHPLPFDLCYRLPQHVERILPKMIWHLRGADLVILSPALFIVDEESDVVCFAMMPSDHLTILGLYQQYYTRFTFDLTNNELLFNPEDCTNDGNAY
ncbi:hypothetical protein J5N97_013528 [Dioscorea zingiberensis]|uniref:Peptidase A1 domain-containing protein n=1 Tax=Dioscorea zingiberensis TaxID=325984 RepID=A0A9D5CS08_9LILI|nr:hypothetical protein J5N97_013528 [Dioscorea zingiberensis]